VELYPAFYTSFRGVVLNKAQGPELYLSSTTTSSSSSSHYSMKALIIYLNISVLLIFICWF
jgi:hypothetical protein